MDSLFAAALISLRAGLIVHSYGIPLEPVLSIEFDGCCNRRCGFRPLHTSEGFEKDVRAMTSYQKVQRPSFAPFR